MYFTRRWLPDSQRAARMDGFGAGQPGAVDDEPPTTFEEAYRRAEMKEATTGDGALPAARRESGRAARRSSNKWEGVASLEQTLVTRASALLVRRPRTVVTSLVALTFAQVLLTLAVGFEVSVPTKYDWDVADDRYTLLRDMIDDAADAADPAAALKARVDATYPWSRAAGVFLSRARGSTATASGTFITTRSRRTGGGRARRRTGF